MAERSRGMLFRKRNVLGAALVAGIGLGIYLGQFKGLGFGGGSWIGLGSKDGETEVKIDSTEPALAPNAKDFDATKAPSVVKVLIDERQFLLREKNGDVPIELPQLMKLIKQAPGDADGFRVRIYEKASARVSAEEKLKEALVAAEIPDSAVLWVPTAVKDIDKR